MSFWSGTSAFLSLFVSIDLARDVQRAIRAIKPMRGATCTGDALQFAAEQLYGDPSSGKQRGTR